MTTTIDRAGTHTPEDLLTMPDGDRYELVEGELRERHRSEESSWIAGAMLAPLWNHNAATKQGWVFPEGVTYQCFPHDPNLVRKADASFVLMSRMPQGPAKRGHTRIAPDVAVEVVSPNDLSEEVDEKVTLWLAAGTSVVVVIFPRTRSVQVFRNDGTARKLSSRDTLTLEDVLPGFSCPVNDLFPPV